MGLYSTLISLSIIFLSLLSSLYLVTASFLFCSGLDIFSLHIPSAIHKQKIFLLYDLLFLFLSSPIRLLTIFWSSLVCSYDEAEAEAEAVSVLPLQIFIYCRSRSRYHLPSSPSPSTFFLPYFSIFLSIFPISEIYVWGSGITMRISRNGLMSPSVSYHIISICLTLNIIWGWAGPVLNFNLLQCTPLHSTSLPIFP